MHWKKWLVSIVAIVAAVAVVITGGVVARRNKAVPWSSAQRAIAAAHLEAVNLEGEAPLRRTIDREHPLQIVTFYPDDTPSPETGAPEDVVSLWNTLHEEDRPYTVILLIPGNLLAPGQGPDWLEQQAALCEQHQIPFMVQVLNGETHKEWLLPMAYIERTLCANPSFQGINVAESYNGSMWRGGADGDQSQYLADGIALMAKYGAFFLWTDTNIFGKDENGSILDWIENNEVLYSTMKRYSQNICMLNKESYGDPSTYPLMLGLWLSGLIGNWGVSSDWWHWQVANYSSLFGQYDELITNPWKQILNMPEALPVESMALAMSMGGTCFKAEAQFFTTALYGRRLSTYEKGIHPLLQEVVQKRLVIPSREEVLASVRTAVVGRENYPLFQYDLSQSRIYPDTSAVGLLPLLPKNLREEERAWFTAHQIQLAEEPHDEAWFTGRESGRPTGDTYANQTGDTLFWLNCLENSEGVKNTTASGFAGAEEVIISAPEHSMVIARETSDGMYVYLNNFRSDKKELIASLTEKEPEQADIRRAVFDWLSVQEDGTLRADASRQRETVLTVATAAQPVLEAPEGTDIQTAREGDRTVYTIRHNGPVAFNLRYEKTQTPPLDTEKPPVENKSAAREDFDSAVYEQALEQGRAVLTQRGDYTPYSFDGYARRYEALRVALIEHTVPAVQLDAMLQALHDAEGQLVSIVAVREAVTARPLDSGRFDHLMRVILSPTPYYNRKETQLELKKEIKNTDFGAADHEAKRQELEKALRVYQRQSDRVS